MGDTKVIDQAVADEVDAFEHTLLEVPGEDEGLGFEVMAARCPPSLPSPAFRDPTVDL